MEVEVGLLSMPSRAEGDGRWRDGVERETGGNELECELVRRASLNWLSPTHILPPTAAFSRVTSLYVSSEDLVPPIVLRTSLTPT